MNPSGKYVLRWKGRQTEPHSLGEIQAKLRDHEIGLLHEIYHGGTWMTLDKFIAQMREGSGTRDRSQLQGSPDATGVSTSLKSPPRVSPATPPYVPPAPLVPVPAPAPPQVFSPPLASPAWPGIEASPAQPLFAPSQAPLSANSAPEEVPKNEVLAYAGFWLRYVASGLDSLVMAPLFWGLSFLAAALSHRGEPTIQLGGLAAILVLQILISWLYFALMESFGPQATLGKLALGLVVTDCDGQRLTFGRASGRFFGKIVSGLTLGIGYFLAAFTERKQALHDMMAGCYVLLKLPRSRIYPN